MKRFFRFSAVMLLLSLRAAAQDGSAVVRLDPALDDIVAPNAKVEREKFDFASPDAKNAHAGERRIWRMAVDDGMDSANSPAVLSHQFLAVAEDGAAISICPALTE